MTSKAVYVRRYDDGEEDAEYCGMADSQEDAKKQAAEYFGCFAEDVMNHIGETDFAYYVMVEA